MNKYKEALFNIKKLFCPHCLPNKTCGKCNLNKDFEVMRELIDKYEKALDKASEQFDDCPLIMLGVRLDCCDECADEYAKCWKEWALKESEKEYGKDKF